MTFQYQVIANGSHVHEMDTLDLNLAVMRCAEGLKEGIRDVMVRVTYVNYFRVTLIQPHGQWDRENIVEAMDIDDARTIFTRERDLAKKIQRIEPLTDFTALTEMGV